MKPPKGSVVKGFGRVAKARGQKNRSGTAYSPGREPYRFTMTVPNVRAPAIEWVIVHRCAEAGWEVGESIMRGLP
jgi:hypothetical protein